MQMAIIIEQMREEIKSRNAPEKVQEKQRSKAKKDLTIH